MSNAEASGKLDVLVVGAGPVGLMLAVLCERCVHALVMTMAQPVSPSPFLCVALVVLCIGTACLCVWWRRAWSGCPTARPSGCTLGQSVETFLLGRPLLGKDFSIHIYTPLCSAMHWHPPARRHLLCTCLLLTRAFVPGVCTGRWSTSVVWA